MRRVTDLTHFENRLGKNARHLRKWAKREGIHAYRLYDRDVPEFPLVIDQFDTDAGTRHLHLQEVDTGWVQTEVEHREWMQHVVASAAQVLDVDPAHVAVKQRARHRIGGDRSGTHPAAQRHEGAEELVVREGGHRLLVDLHGYLDTGLFLDHRKTRSMVEARAAGTRFLNLFAYTASFTVYAAAGGSVASESVDLSNTYCAWAERNLALNAIDPHAHRVVRADAFAWLRDAVSAFEAGDRDAVDLIVVDPPTFSNSKSMQGILDIQRDHPWLIRQCLALLAPGGEIFFSTNLRSFELDELIQQRARFTEISSATVPEDFRDRRIHRCWRIVSPEPGR